MINVNLQSVISISKTFFNILVYISCLRKHITVTLFVVIALYSVPMG